MDQFQPPSNPQLPPQQPNPQQPNPQQPGQAPQYGQNQPPQFGQPPAPQFGQNQPPQYGQNQPSQYPQAQYGQAPYGQQFQAYPSGPMGYSQLPPVEKPATLKNAVILMFVGAALALLGGIFSLFQIDRVLDLALSQANTSELSGSSYESAKSIAQAAAYGTAIFSLVISTALWIWMALVNNAGKSWARVVATVFAGIGIIGGIYSLISGLVSKMMFWDNLIFGILTLLVSIAALVLIWLKPSTEYYKFKSQKVLY
ncbi:hypothetical protein [Psychromicrobium sp. YIM B11713]|uniref:hypothetical protein n=1 Tax=Psychromicrobium sp. YIM B11713 TaxID=3145233 RepID=UPI00374F572F